MAGFGEKPFGLRQVKVAPLTGSTLALPAAQRLMFKERLVSGELRGNDRVAAIVGITDALEWEFDNGGISLEALAIITGRTLTTSGTTPNQVITMTGEAGDNYPYFRIFGQSIGDVSTDDVHVILYKCKCMGAVEGEFKDGEFYITKMSGVAIDNGTKIYDVIQHETAVALPAS